MAEIFPVTGHRCLGDPQLILAESLFESVSSLNRTGYPLPFQKSVMLNGYVRLRTEAKDTSARTKNQ